MSEPTPKPPDPTRPAAQQPAEDSDRLKTYPTDGDRLKARPTPVAKRLEAERPKSSPVISKSYRVVELPPPPIVITPAADEAETDEAERHDTLPDGLAAPPEGPPEPAIELDALQIRARSGGDSCAAASACPPRWEQWLADPQRRNNVGVGVSVAVHVALVLLLAFVLHAPPPRRARNQFTPGRSSRPSRRLRLPGKGLSRQLREPVVRQATAGELETLGPSTDSRSEISNLRSEMSDLKSQPAGPEALPPVVPAEGTGVPPSSILHPPSFGPRPGPMPGMAGGSQAAARLAPGGRCVDASKAQSPHAGRPLRGHAQRRRHAAKRRGRRSARSTGSWPINARTAVGTSTTRPMPASITAPIPAARAAPPRPPEWPCCPSSARATRIRKASSRTSSNAGWIT